MSMDIEELQFFTVGRNWKFGEGVDYIAKKCFVPSWGLLDDPPVKKGNIREYCYKPLPDSYNKI